MITTYYVYLLCGTDSGPQNNVIIQPIPAVPGNIIGESILSNGKCWVLINISNNLSQLQNIYNYNTYYNTNYFTQVFGEIFTSCENCLKYNGVIGGEGVTVTNCQLMLRNSKNCYLANTSGQVLVNSVLVYSFDSGFNGVLSPPLLINVNNMDNITINLVALSDSICGFNLSDTDNSGNIFIDNNSVTNTTITYNYKTYCGGKKEIEIFSSCVPV
jgi:hypothetical protein